MAEKRQIKYEGLKQRQSQLSIQPSGTVGTPSTPPQYNVASDNLKSANRHQQFAKALGVLNPALKNLAFSLAEGAKNDKIAAAKDKKLKLKEEELLGLELFKQHVDFFAPSENFPNGKLITKNGLEVDLSDRWNDETGKIQRGKGSPEETFKKLGIQFGNYRALTEYNLDRVRYWHNVGKARKLSKQFNETIPLNQASIDRLQEEFQGAKNFVDDQGVLGPKGGKPYKDLTFAEYVEKVVNAAYEGIRLQLPEEVWHEIDIETGINNVRKAYLQSSSDTLNDTLTRQYQELVSGYFSTLPTINPDGTDKVLTLTDYIQWRDQNLKGIPIGGTDQADLNTINFLTGKIENCKTRNECKRYNPSFLFENTYQTIDDKTGEKVTKQHPGIHAREKLKGPSIAALNAYDKKLDEFQKIDDDNKKVEDEKELQRLQENAAPKIAQLNIDIGTSPGDKIVNLGKLKTLTPELVKAYPDNHETIIGSLRDDIESAYRDNRDFDVKQQERDAQVDPEADRKNSAEISEEVRKIKQFGIFTEVEGEKVLSQTWDKKLIDVEERLNRLLSESKITSRTKKDALAEIKNARDWLDEEAKPFLEKIEETEKEEKKKKAFLGRNDFFEYVVQKPEAEGENLKLLRDYAEHFSDATDQRFAVSFVKAKAKEANATVDPKTNPVTARNIYNKIDGNKVINDTVAKEIKTEINNAYLDKKLNTSDWKFFLGLVKDKTINPDDKFQEYTSFEPYKFELGRIEDLLNTTKTMMVKGIGWEIGIIQAHTAAVYAYRKQMYNWASKNKELALDEEKVAEQANLIAEGILKSDEIQSVYGKSKSKMEVGEIFDINENLLIDLKNNYFPNLKVELKETKNVDEEGNVDEGDISPKLYEYLVKGITENKEFIINKKVDAVEVERMLNSFDNGILREFWNPYLNDEGARKRREADKDLTEMFKGRFGPFSIFPSNPEGIKQATFLKKFLFLIRAKHLKQKGIDE